MSKFGAKQAFKKTAPRGASELEMEPPELMVSEGVVKEADVENFNRQNREFWLNVKEAYNRLDERVTDLESSVKTNTGSIANLDERVTELEP